MLTRSPEFQRRNGVTLLLNSGVTTMVPTVPSGTGSPLASSTTSHRNRSDHTCRPSCCGDWTETSEPSVMPNWSETSAPQDRSSFWRLAGDNGSAATMILRTEDFVRSIPRASARLAR